MPWIDFNKFCLFPIKWSISIYNQVLFAKQIQYEVHLCNIRLLIFFVISPEICYSRICQHIIECTSRTLFHIIVPFTFHIWKTHKLQSSTEEFIFKKAPTQKEAAYVSSTCSTSSTSWEMNCTQWIQTVCSISPHVILWTHQPSPLFSAVWQFTNSFCSAVGL